MGLLTLPSFALFALLVVCTAWKRIIQFLRDRHNRIKLGESFYGPPTLPIIGNAHQLPLSSRDWQSFLCKLSADAQKEGKSAIRLWLGTRLLIIPTTGESARTILESQAEIKKGPDYALHVQWLNEALLTSYDDKWRNQRRMLTPTFHFRHLNGYIGCFNRQASKFVESLARNMAKTLEGDELSLDMYPIMSYFTLDIITGAIMGIDLSGPEKEKEKESYEASIKNMNVLAFLRYANPLFLLTPIWYLSGHGFQVIKSIKVARQMSGMVINQRLSSRDNRHAPSATGKSADNDQTLTESSRTVFLDLLLDLYGEGKMSLEDVHSQVDTFMFAGHDTTAHALSWFIWSMACHADIQEQLYREICEHFPPDQPLILDDLEETEDEKTDVKVKSLASLNELRYLDQCIKETMRMFAPVPLIQRIIRNDIKIDGLTVPIGTSVSISATVIHHNEKVYPDPYVFNPDNFLPDRIAERNPYDYIPFSAGPRNCIGQRFAMTAIKIFAVHFMQRFRISTNVPFRENRPHMQTMCVPDLGIPVTLHRR